LILDFVDAESKELVRLGWATRAVGDRENAEARIREAVETLLEEFPPSIE